jgi:hypothetical protein
MKTMLTELTRPRRASGVASWMIVERATMLTSSAIPATTSAAIESGKALERPGDGSEAEDGDRRERARPRQRLAQTGSPS